MTFTYWVLRIGFYHPFIGFTTLFQFGPIFSCHSRLADPIFGDLDKFFCRARWRWLSCCSSSRPGVDIFSQRWLVVNRACVVVCRVPFLNPAFASPCWGHSVRIVQLYAMTCQMNPHFAYLRSVDLYQLWDGSYFFRNHMVATHNRSPTVFIGFHWHQNLRTPSLSQKSGTSQWKLWGWSNLCQPWNWRLHGLLLGIGLAGFSACKGCIDTAQYTVACALNMLGRCTEQFVYFWTPGSVIFSDYLCSIQESYFMQKSKKRSPSGLWSISSPESIYISLHIWHIWYQKKTLNGRNLITFEAGILNTLLCLLWLSFARRPVLCSPWSHNGPHWSSSSCASCAFQSLGLQDLETVRWARALVTSVHCRVHRYA